MTTKDYQSSKTIYNQLNQTTNYYYNTQNLMKNKKDKVNY